MSVKTYWPLVLKSLKEAVSTNHYQAWFSSLDFVKTVNFGRKIVLSVPSEFNKKYLESKFKKQLKQAISRYYPQVLHIDYQIAPKKDEDYDRREDVFGIQNHLQGKKTELNFIENQNNSLNLTSTYKANKNLNYLNPKYTFENFVETSSNKLATNVARAIVEKPGTLYNPVFIYSGVGLGKTHLLQAIGQKMLERRPDFKIRYTTCETFFNLFISGIQNKKDNVFKDFYRDLDLLLIDDIQFISGKEATQEAFFHTFNELHQQNKQIVITSDKPPQNLNNVAERLVSRFNWGMVVDISKPDLEDRISVIKDKSERMKLPLTLAQMGRIAEMVTTNFRDIEGVLNRIEARVRLIPGVKLEDFEINKILSNYNLASTITININPINNSPENLFKLICETFCITKQELLGKNRSKNIAEARQVAMYLAKQEMGLSFPSVGKLFDRDHTTALHAHKKISKEMLENQKLKSKLDYILAKLSQ